MKILFATDGSPYSKAALEEIANRPYPPQSSVHIISIIDNIVFTPGDSPMGAMNEYYAEAGRTAMSKAEDNLNNARKVLQMGNPDLAITTAIINGSPKNSILEEAEKLKTDLIIVGSHGYGAVKRFLLGSVSQAVALHAHCSVEIVRSHALE
jgi:nucleotide-binding universal stress UspA family protein